MALGRGPDSLFDLRERELQTIALEAQAMRPVSEDAAALSAEFGGIVEEKRQDLDETMRSSAARIETTRLFLIIVATGSVLPFLMLALFYVGRNVAGRLRRLAVAMSALANGDTRIEVPTAGAHDEIGEMAEALQFFKRQTIGAQQLAQEVTDSIRQVALAAGQATSAIGQVSGGANTQLAALRHVANGLQQSADAITLVTANTHSARERAQQMADLVEHGRTEMAGMVAAVNAIAESSAQVSNSSTTSPASRARPTCCRSTPRSRRRAPARTARASPWSPRRSASSPTARLPWRPRSRRRSATPSSRPSMASPRRRWSTTASR